MLSPESFLGPYRLIARLGAGGMGEVWKAEDTRLGRIVAIKVLSQTFAMDADATARLKREARTAAQLYHPNIAMIHSIEQDGDVLFIVMEYVEGEPLTKRLLHGAMSEADICRVARGVADALAEAHEKGIVHRDIKPDNIIVTPSRVKVLDFGIAKQVGLEAQPTPSDAPTAFVTQQGMILGTVHYMSPEQALGKELDGRTDIFSLGVVLYEAATGKLPFQGETITETMMHIIRDAPPDARTINPKISAGLKSIIDRCLRKKREERWSSAGELARALEEQLGKSTTAPYTAQTVKKSAVLAPPTVIEAPATKPSSSKWMWISLVIVLLAVAIIGALAMRPHKPGPAPVPVATTTTAAPATTTTAATTSAAPSTSTVSVTAAPQIIEKTPPPPITQSSPPPPPREAEQMTTTTAAPTTPAPAAPNVDQLYEQGVGQLAGGDKPEARKTFLDVVTKDSHYAKAHFRLGEIAVLNHNLGYARTELETAWADKEKMDARERHLTRLCVAITNGNRFEVQKVGMEIERMWPGDPDLEAIRRAYPPEERPGRFRRLRP
jgi:serine/threonine protein kinase